MFTRVALLGVVVAFGCSSSGGTPSSSGGATGTGGAGSGSGGATGTGGAGPGSGGVTGTLVGSVRVELFLPDKYATATAQFFDGSPAPMSPLQTVQDANGCMLRVPVTCPSNCEPGFSCSDDKQCIKKPSPMNVGNITVDGVASSSLVLLPEPPMFAYSGPTLTTFPPCAEGDDVKAQASLFSFTGKCITPLEVTSQLPIPVTSGMPTHITWKAPGKPGISRVLLSLEISHHGGGSKGQVDCDVPDTGSFDIPASLVTALLALGRAGYPTVEMSRVSTAKDPTQSRASLTIVSSAGQLAVDTGVISCGMGESDPCKSPTTCDITSKTCR